MADGDKHVSLAGLKAVYDHLDGNISDLKSAVEDLIVTDFAYDAKNTSQAGLDFIGGAIIDNGNTNSSAGYAIRQTNASLHKANFGDYISCDSGYEIRVAYYSTNTIGANNLVKITQYTTRVDLDPEYYFAVCISLAGQTGTISGAQAKAATTYYASKPKLIEALQGDNVPLNSEDAWAAFIPSGQTEASADYLPTNRIYQITHSADVANLPTNPFSGTLISFDYKTDASSRSVVQLAFKNSGEIYKRMMWGTGWRENWRQIALISDVPYASTAYKALGNFLAVGDSWTVSLAYPTAGQGQNGITVKSWAEHFAEMSGSECTIIARGGRTTKAFIDTGESGDYGEAVADTSDYAILYLGINDITAITATSPTETIEQFTTYYTQIVNDLLTNHNFVFCLNIPKAGHTSSGRGTVNAAIASVCESINNAYLVDLMNVPDTITPLSANGHLSSVGYTAFAEMVAEGISKAMASNSYFATGIDQ